MAYKALLFGTGRGIKIHKSYYPQAIAVSDIEIIGHGFFKVDGIHYVYADGRRGGG